MLTNDTVTCVLSVRGLTKVASDQEIVRGVDVDLTPGTVTVLLGPEDAGKTTLLRMVCGLSSPTSGAISVAGLPFEQWPSPAHVAGGLFEPEVMHPARTGRAQLRIAAELAGLPVGRVDEVLELMGLSAYAEHKIGSYGQVHRLWLGLAHALLADPPLLVLDEPIRELPEDDARTVRSLLRTHAKRGGTVLLSSASMSEVDETVDRALVMHNGGIIADGPVAMLTKAGSCQVQASNTKLLAEALSRAGVRIRPLPDGFVAVQLSADRVDEFAQQVGVRITGLREGERTLEDVLADLNRGA